MLEQCDGIDVMVEADCGSIHMFEPNVIGVAKRDRYDAYTIPNAKAMICATFRQQDIFLSAM